MTSFQVTLLSVHRATECIFELRLTVDPERGARGIAFIESYEYLRLRSDPGQEYAYTTYAPYDALETLAGSGDGDAAGRLLVGFQELVESGELGDHLPLKENHQRVAGWWSELGVPVETDVWFWANSD